MSQSVRAVGAARFACVALAAMLVGSPLERARGAAPTLPYTSGKAENATAKAAVCIACHGPNGNSTNPEWPRLAGQNAVYTAEQLHLFKANVRANPTMMPMGSMLSDQDIDDLSVYYEGQTPTGLEADPSFWQAGESLYRSGDPARSIPACIACHGANAEGKDNVPRLAGQHPAYLVKQLAYFKSLVRGNAPLMHAVTDKMTFDQMEAVTAYAASK